MAGMLRPRLDRLTELSKQVNASTDEAGRIVQGVETYLSDVLHLGVRASITLEHDEDEGGDFCSTTEVVYGRYGSRFRIFVSHFLVVDGGVEKDEETLWANCSRDLKLRAFNEIPALLDELVKKLEGTLELVETSSRMIESLLPPIAPKEKGAKP